MHPSLSFIAGELDDLAKSGGLIPGTSAKALAEN
jgi:hypothetical protein